MSKYWTFKHKEGTDGPYKSFMKYAYENNCCLMQFEYGIQKTNDVTRNWEKILKINEGDYVFLRGDERIYAFGKVIQSRKNEDFVLNAQNIINSKEHGDFRSDKYKGVIKFYETNAFYENLDGEGNWGQRIDVDSWKFYNEKGINAKSNDFYSDNSVYSPIREVNKEIAKKWIKQLENNYYQHHKGEFMKDQIKELLKSNKNLILTGAPGFGKTYLAKEVAKELTGSDKDVSPNIEFVQFHPSFDYTDFVEGLRPVKKKDQNDIGFELKDGIFRKFCDKARKDTSNKPYVFIIDEINRADISKVFGELFFSIDQGYRGEKGSVKTQYANLRVEGDQLFFVPENVYIIGTMNDIDRSVENFDFAIRRRFAWINLTPELQKNEEDSKPDMRTSMWDNFIWQLENEEKVESPKINTLKEILGDKENKKAYKRIYALNKAISDYDNSTLGKDYQIGPAYFHNLLSYIEDDYPFEKLWQYHLKILLEEYLRGLPNKDDILKSLKEAYDSPKSEE